MLLPSGVFFPPEGFLCFSSDSLTGLVNREKRFTNPVCESEKTTKKALRRKEDAGGQIHLRNTLHDGEVNLLLCSFPLFGFFVPFCGSCLFSWLCILIVVLSYTDEIDFLNGLVPVTDDIPHVLVFFTHTRICNFFRAHWFSVQTDLTSLFSIGIQLLQQGNFCRCF